MAKTVFVSTQPIGQVNTSAFVRIISLFKDNIPNIDIVHKDFERYNKSIDNIVIAYGTFYADFKNIMYFLEKNKDKRFFYLVNEYGLVPNGDVYRFLIKHNYDIIASYEESAIGAKHNRNFYSINLNCTGYYNDIDIIPFEKRPKNLIYWGRFRPDRKEYFDKYLDKNFIVSTGEKNEKYFESYNVELIPPLILRNNELNKYKYSLYIEDKYSHKNFTYPASRFYEALSYNIIMFYDINSKTTFNKSIYKIKDFYFVSSKEELHEKISIVEKNSESYLQDIKFLQQTAIIEQQTLFKDIEEIFNSTISLPQQKCSNCNLPRYIEFRCHNCGKSLCSNCLEIYKKHYCLSCLQKLGLEKENFQSVLF